MIRKVLASLVIALATVAVLFVTGVGDLSQSLAAETILACSNTECDGPNDCDPFFGRGCCIQEDQGGGVQCLTVSCATSPNCPEN